MSDIPMYRIGEISALADGSAAVLIETDGTATREAVKSLVAAEGTLTVTNDADGYSTITIGT